MESLSPLLCMFMLVLFFVGIIQLAPLLIILYKNSNVTMSKGDQRIISKVRPYLRYDIHENNLPHFCHEFWVDPQVDGGPNHTIIEATTSSERPLYSTSYSTDTFSINVLWAGDQKPRYYAYYLPSASFVSITTCGKTTGGINIALNIPVFNDYGTMNDWAGSDERDPDSPDIVFLAQFDACPTLRTVQFNTTGYPEGKWYLLFGAGYQNSSSSLEIKVDLEFTKHPLELNSTVVGTCTATAESGCAVAAPTEGDVYVLLTFKVDSKTNGQVETIISCSKYEVTPYVMYFMILPMAVSFLIAAAIWWKYCNFDNDDNDDGGIDTSTSSFRPRFTPPRMVVDIPPDYDQAGEYPTRDVEHTPSMTSNLTYDEGVYIDLTETPYSSNPSLSPDRPPIDHPPAYESVVAVADSQRDQGDEGDPVRPPETRRRAATVDDVADEHGQPIASPSSEDMEEITIHPFMTSNDSDDTVSVTISFTI